MQEACQSRQRVYVWILIGNVKVNGDGTESAVLRVL